MATEFLCIAGVGLQKRRDEWFYVLEGEFQFEVGADRFRLQPGDSLLAPTRSPTSGPLSVRHVAGFWSRFSPLGTSSCCCSIRSGWEYRSCF
ncbi:MAG: cupin domain-containing protein [Chloroflexi bacterium]|nr:MAG: cupin domain-containing protein [Chloroflexota bacterium]